MASRAPRPFPLSPLQGGRRAPRRRRTMGAGVIALAIVIAASAVAMLAWAF